MSDFIKRVKPFEEFTFAYTVGEGNFGEITKPVIISKIPGGVVFHSYREYAAYKSQGTVREFKFIVEGNAAPQTVELQFDYIKENKEGGMNRYEITEKHLVQVEIVK